MHKLRSIDVWDTLLRRDCHPESIKLAMAIHLFLLHRVRVAGRYQDPRALYHIRLQVEHELAAAGRTRGDDEYLLADVVQAWGQRVLGFAFDEVEIARLVQLEFDMEVSRSHPDPQIAEFLRDYPAELTVFLSDFYMPGPRMCDLLALKGLADIVPTGVVSCDVHLNKRSGHLYEYLHRTYGVEPSEHVHVGDNLWSDVEAARRSGVCAVHYAPMALHKDRLEHESLFSSRPALFAALREQVARACKAIECGRSQEDATALRIGSEAAPLFIGFALWLAEEFASRQLSSACFLSREGVFLHRVYTALFPDRHHFGHDLPPTGVLELSRLSTFAACLQSPTLQHVRRMWSLFGTQRLRGMLLTLGLELEPLAGTLAAVGLDLDETLEKPDMDSRLSALFSTAEFNASLRASVERQRTLLTAYLRQRDVPTTGCVGIVDVGWRGTIQDHLAALLPEVELHGLYLGLRQFINLQPPNVHKTAYGPDENRELGISPLFESFAVLEMLCMAPGGSVVGYESTANGTVEPLRRTVLEEDHILAGFVAGFQEGVLNSIAVWRDAIKRHALSAGELRPIALQVWRGLHGRPDRDLLRAFMQAPQQDFFGFGDVFRRNHVPSLTTVVLSPFSSVRRRELLDFVRRVQWPAAVSGFEGLGVMHRQVLTFLFALANQFRRVRSRLRRRR